MRLPFVALFLSVVVSLAACGSAKAQSPATDSLTAALRALARADSPLPGFAVAVVDSGGTRYAAGFGLADRARGTLFTPATVQQIGSVSKTLIGVALLKAQELGLLTLNAEINSLLPFRVVNPHGPYRPMRVLDLATHTSGVLDRAKPYLATYQWFPRGTAFTFDSAIASPGHYAPAALAAWLRAYLVPGGRYYRAANFAPAAPGAAYCYSNVGAALAAYLIEVRSGLSYAEFTRRHILTPVGMTSAGWTLAQVRAFPHATGYRPTGKPYPPYFGLTYPDGGLHASTLDMAAYLRHVIRGAQNGRDALLTPVSFRELLRPRFQPDSLPTGVPVREPNAGIFWAMRPDGDIGHVGSDPGVFVACFFNPRTGVGRVFMTNVDFDDNPAAAKQFAAVWRTLGQFSAQLGPGY
ncbi:MAG: beta-lactamase family protein [Hymenobacteraceae bacterium]|nr:beta-lactamase family protein [Hymenobacteraceae bacterium]